MDLIDLEDETIDAEVMDSLAVSMDNFRVSEYAQCSYVWYQAFIILKLKGMLLYQPVSGKYCPVNFPQSYEFDYELILWPILAP